ALAVAAPCGLRDRGVRGAALPLARQEGEPVAVLLRGGARPTAHDPGGRLGAAGRDAHAGAGGRPLTPAVSPAGRGSLATRRHEPSRAGQEGRDTKPSPRRGEGRVRASRPYFEGV